MAASVVKRDRPRLPALEHRDPVEDDVTHASGAGAKERTADEVDHVDAVFAYAVPEIRLKRLLRVARALEPEVGVEERDGILSVGVGARDAATGELGVHGRRNLLRKAGRELRTAARDRTDVKPFGPGVVSGIPVVPCKLLTHHLKLYHICNTPKHLDGATVRCPR